MSSYLSLLAEIGSSQYENDKYSDKNSINNNIDDVNHNMENNENNIDDINYNIENNTKNSDNCNGIIDNTSSNYIEDLGYFGVFCLSDTPINNRKINNNDNDTNDNYNINDNNNDNDNDKMNVITNDNDNGNANNNQLHGNNCFNTNIVDITRNTYKIPEIDVWPSDDIDLNNNKYEFFTDYESNVTNNTSNTSNIKFKKEIQLLCEKKNSLVELNSSTYERNDRNGTVISKISQQSISIADNVLKKVGVQASTAMSIGEKLMNQIHKTIKSNKTISDATSCANETFLFAMDRANTASLYISQSLTADDPETMHWKNIRACSKDKWDSVRLCMASLSWNQRQLLEETKENDADEWFDIDNDTNEFEDNSNDNDINEDENTNNGYNEDDKIETIYFNIAGWKAWSEENTINKKKVDEEARIRRNEELEPRLQRWLTKAALEGDEEAQYALTRWFAPPAFIESKSCFACNRMFGINLFRHHCRFCGNSFCTPHSSHRRKILRYGMINAVRVCSPCARVIDIEVWRDSMQWRRLRTEAYLKQNLIPYFCPKVDRRVDKALRVIEGSIKLVKNTLCLNYPAHILIETVDILKRYGLSGLAGVLLRKDFVEAVETLKRISGMDKSFSITLHELTACIYYKLAIDRGLRGCNPEGERLEHENLPYYEISEHSQKAVDDLDEAIRLAPLALTIAYEENSFECQRLAKSQGWSTIYINAHSAPEEPAYVLLASDLSQNITRKEVVVTIRGTKSIQDLVTDIRAAPYEFPPNSEEIVKALSGYPSSMETTYYKNIDMNSLEDDDDRNDVGNMKKQWEWLQISSDMSYACGGMARAAMWIITQVGQSILKLHQEGYDVILVGHSLGGAVASLATYLLASRIPSVRCVTYGCPSCVDSLVAEELKTRVTSWVLHDDIISRLTPQSIRLLMKELIVFREQVFRHLEQDWSDVIARASNLWTPRWRDHNYNSNGNNNNDAVKTAAEILSTGVSQKTSQKDADESPDSSLVFVDEDEIKDLWLPGKIIHIYSHRGQYKAIEVPRDFGTLRRIEVQGNIFRDHDAKNIFNSLLEVRAVRNSTGKPPEWQLFSVTACQCCHNSFTWHSTFRGDAQEYRERYNCRNCGRLVCGPCSIQKRAIPRLGLIFPVRICDTCFYKGEFADVKL